MASEYKLGDKLGEGSFSTLYKATHTCAVKAIDISGVPDHEKAAKKKEWKEEIQALAKVRGHPNIVEYRNSYTSVVKLWAELEYCNGGTLNDYIIKKNPGGEIKHQFMVEIASGVAFLHSQGVLHRDLTPENIMIDIDGDQPHIKISDFGLVKVLTSCHYEGQLLQYYLTKGGSTEYYMAPEVYDGQFTEKADVFSLGMIYYAMVPYPSWNTIGTKKLLLVECSVGIKGKKEDIPFGKYIHESGECLSYREVFEEEVSQKALKLFDSMIHKEPHSRPSAEETKTTLESVSAKDLLLTSK